jgi:hypothetical protein
MAPEQRSKVRLDEFVAKVVPDPNSAGELLLVSGFLGKSSEADHTRVYWDASLNGYVDVRDTDIAHTEALPKETSPLGGSYVWVKRDAKVYFGAGGQSTKGKFFEGPLMNMYGGRFTGGGAAPMGITEACHVTWICPPSPYFPCASGYCTRSLIECTALCGTQNIICNTIACPVQSLICNTTICPVQTGGACLTPGCPIGSVACGVVNPVQGQGGVQAAFQAPHTFYCTTICYIPTRVACTHQPNCYSMGCYPTIELGCDYAVGHGQARAANAAIPAFQFGNPSLVCSYAAGCWFSWDACPSLIGIGCGGGGGGTSVRFCPTV